MAVRSTGETNMSGTILTQLRGTTIRSEHQKVGFSDEGNAFNYTTQTDLSANYWIQVHYKQVTQVLGVWLATDTTKSGTNYITPDVGKTYKTIPLSTGSGTTSLNPYKSKYAFNQRYYGYIDLDTSLADGTEVIVDYVIESRNVAVAGTLEGEMAVSIGEYTDATLLAANFPTGDATYLTAPAATNVAAIDLGNPNIKYLTLTSFYYYLAGAITGVEIAIYKSNSGLPQDMVYRITGLSNTTGPASDGWDIIELNRSFVLQDPGKLYMKWTGSTTIPAGSLIVLNFKEGRW